MKQVRIAGIAGAMAVLATLYFNCSSGGGSTSVVNLASVRGTDLSASGAVASALTGALNNHGMTPACANDIYQTNDVDLTATSPIGTAVLQVSASTGTPVRCNTLGNVSNLILQSQFIDSNGVAASANLPGIAGAIVVDHGLNGGTLTNFDTVAILPTIGKGFGTSISYGANHIPIQESVTEHVWSVDNNQATLFDHTIVGTADITNVAGVNTIEQASFTVYDNVAHVVGLSAISNLIFAPNCATPVSGTISTTFQAGQNVQPTPAGQAMVGQTEELEFTGCGAAALTNIEGQKGAFALTSY